MIDTEHYAEGVNNLAAARYAKLAGNYQVQTAEGPVNAGFFRDNIMDILEETTDVVNIAGILFERLTGYENSDVFLLAAGGLQLLEEAVNTMIAACVYLDNCLPPAFRKEDVAREVARGEVGLCADE